MAGRPPAGDLKLLKDELRFLRSFKTCLESFILCVFVSCVSLLGFSFTIMYICGIYVLTYFMKKKAFIANNTCFFVICINYDDNHFKLPF